MKTNCRPCPVRRKGLCGDLLDEELGSFAAIQDTEMRFKAGKTLFLEGDDAAQLFIVRSGWAVIYAALEDGRRQILRFALPGTLIGFQTAPDGTMPCTAEALTDLSACVVSRHRFMQLCERNPHLTLSLASRLAAESALDWNLLGGLGQCSALERIARLLLALYDRLNTGDGKSVTLPFGQTILADATGLTAVHVCRTLKQMRDDGLLTFNKGLLVLGDLNRLRATAQGQDGDTFLPARGAGPDIGWRDRTPVPFQRTKEPTLPPGGRPSERPSLQRRMTA